MKKILVIDDDKPFCNAVANTLRREGYGLFTAGDGAAGLAVAFAERPSLILTDIVMAGQNGFDLLKELRRHPEISATPVILMTGMPTAGGRFYMDQGADDYLEKPFTMAALLATVRARLERQDETLRVAEAQHQAERVSADEKLRLFNSALESAANGIAITERDGKILWINHAFTRLTGYTAEEVVGQNPRVLKSGRHDPEFYAKLWGTIAAGNVWHGELLNQRKDGTCYFEEMTITPVRGAQGEIQNFIAIKQDVSARKQIEQVLAQERDLLQALMDRLPDHIYFKDLNSCYTRINRAHARHLGVATPEAAIGKSDADFYPPHVARQKLVDEQRLFTTGEALLGLVEQCETGAGSQWISSTKVPVLGEHGTITGLVGISRDITADKAAERERLMMEVQLRQAHKLESIGQLAAGIAHEINTPTQYVGDNTRFVKDSFTVISEMLASYKELLTSARQQAVTPELLARHEEKLAASDLDYLSEQIPSALKESLEGVERVSKIVRAMKEFSHPGGQEKSLADLNKAIESTTTVARNEWKYVAELKLELEPALPLVPCFLGEVNQCLLNLIVNAAHTIGDVVKARPNTKGCITVQTQRENDYVAVRVTDTGTGIPEAARPKIFEPFFTTKAVGQGTGQGLAMIYGSIVKHHAGTVTFETEVGQGTTFTIRLPLKTRTAAGENAPASTERLTA